MTDSDRQIGRRWFEEVWNKGRREVIEEMVAPHGVVHDGSTVSVGPEGFYAFYDRMRAAFSDIRVTVEDEICQDDKVCVRWTCSLRHTGEGMGFPPSDQTATFTGISILRVADGKLIEGWQNWDMLGMLEQLKGSRTAATYIGA
jgi:steroid delta-isomerase-like uncharacterized protein